VLLIAQDGGGRALSEDFDPTHTDQALCQPTFLHRLASMARFLVPGARSAVRSDSRAP
jgi:hypothetical protein